MPQSKNWYLREYFLPLIMKKFLLALVLCTTINSLYSQDTFSIVAVDPATGEVGSAGASCVDGSAAFGGLIDIISAIVPGRGGVNSQAYVCIPNGNLQNAIDQMIAGSSPDEIITWLVANDEFPCSSSFSDPSYRQYGIADLDTAGNPRTAGWTGSNADDYKDDIQGATYSVQGNILLNATVLENMEANFNSTTGTLADKLMAAMQGANFAGADMRCLDRGTSSTTAYLQVYRATDAPGNPYLRLNIEEMPFGEEPIDSLQSLYDSFLAVDEFSAPNFVLYPNPASNYFTLTYSPQTVISQAVLVDMQGKMVTEFAINPNNNGQQRFNISAVPNGVYFLALTTNSGF